ncbi:PEGA domain-containing protein [bacterium]|nr:PEGA domain-containing protein [bacterium]
MFRPKANSEISFQGSAYRFLEHPSAPGYSFGQEGRAATVYQLKGLAGKGAYGEEIALKVFKPQHRSPQLVSFARKTAKFAQIKGFEVFRRTVLAPPEFESLLAEERDLIYAIIMPWVDGPNWMEIIGLKQELNKSQCQVLARAFAQSMLELEQEGLSHCDLSASNVLLPELVRPGAGVEFVDVEQFYGPGIDRPEILTSGSPGYSTPALAEQMWSRSGDRMAGAILLAEILAWCDPQVREQAGLESFFEPDEVANKCARYDLLEQSLRKNWGDAPADLLAATWNSKSLEQAPLFADWLMAIPKGETRSSEIVAAPAPAPSESSASPMLKAQLDLASALEVEGKPEQALSAYRRAQKLASTNQALVNELDIVISELEREVDRQKAQEVPAPAVVAADPKKDANPRKPFPWGSVIKLAISILIAAGVAYGANYYWTHRPGTITVSTSVADATVLLDGVEKGKVAAQGKGGMLKLEAVPPGPHVISVALKGYRAPEQSIDLQAGAQSPLSFDPQPILVDLTLKMNLPEAEVSVNDQPFRTAKSGTKLSFWPGPYTVKAKAVGYQDFTGNVTLEVDAPRTLEVNLKPLPHKLEVKTSVEPARVVIKRKDTGALVSKGVTKANKYACDVEPGVYTVKVTKEGYEDKTTEVTVQMTDQSKPVTVALKEIPAAPVYFESPPPVYVEPRWQPRFVTPSSTGRTYDVQ